MSKSKMTTEQEVMKTADTVYAEVRGKIETILGATGLCDDSGNIDNLDASYVLCDEDVHWYNVRVTISVTHDR